MTRTSVLFTLGTCFLASRARAQAREQTEPVRIEYRGPSDCSSASAIARAVKARTPRARAAEPGEAARTFAIEMRSETDRVSATLAVTNDDGTSAPREIAGPTCAHVVDALALIIALDVDPGASTAPVPTEPPERQPAETQVPSAPVAPPRDAEPQSGFEWTGLVGAAAETRAGVASIPLFGGAATIEGAMAAFPQAAIRVGAHGAWSGDVDSLGIASTHFRLATAMLELCPVRWGDAASLQLCADGELGWLDAWSKNVPGSRHETHPWRAAGALARAGWIVRAPFRVELEAGGAVPFVRYRFLFPPDTTISRVSPVAGLVGIGLAAQWR